MPPVSESKIDCTVYISHDVDPVKKTGPLKGLLHLFEQANADPKLTFWYGVVDLACKADEIAATGVTPLLGVRIEIELIDGRRGIARYRLAVAVQDGADANYRLAIVGAESLRSDPSPS